ncbi:MAG: SdiA-regulated domain-containing protein [candidate division KSB1 bacterium]|nr:SdiA-regulated domain-containing protein [candidate division KSB1 bacterium]MDZ7368295.1 SdiA-regulated domain-containing protein [candidate division KSB1 bacterium]MDZ7406125.1 SdiA-regulated domain-containing protein [candidate division KSB1 bacterium]
MTFFLFILLGLRLGGGEVPEIKGYDFENKKIDYVKLPNELSEASGLAFSNERLLCHNDEQGIVYELDHRTGAVRRRFFVGKPLMYRGDLEGIAVKKDTIFMATSSGAILRFLPGKDGEKIAFQTFRTPLSIRNDVEGLTYDPVTDCLLLACKGEANIGISKALTNEQKAVYAFSLKTYKLLPQPRFVIPASKIAAQMKEKEFAPSAIERHPRTGNFFILAARGNAIVEVDANGNLLGVASLPKSVHPQPEGLAIAPDGTLAICNEGQGKAGRLVVYSPQ